MTQVSQGIEISAILHGELTQIFDRLERQVVRRIQRMQDNLERQHDLEMEEQQEKEFKSSFI